MGGVGKAVKSVIKNPARAVAAGITGGLSEGFQQDPYGTPLPFRNPLNVGLNAALHIGEDGNPIPGPFVLNPAQVEANRAAILGEGQKQYNETLAGIDEAGTAAQKYAGQTLNRMLPGIYEDLNSKNLLNSSALPQEIGRKASELAEDVAAQQAQARLGALSGRQGFQSQALQRGLSLEDFVTNANVAKTLGAQMAPQVNNGKGNTGAILQGAGSLASGIGKLLK